MHRLRISLLTALAAMSLLPASLGAEPTAPRTYRAYIRYRIDAVGDDHIIQYQEMLKNLKVLGLTPDPRPEGEAEDERATLMTGLVPSKDARALLAERHARALLLAGKDDARLENLKDKPDAQLRIQIELSRQNSLAAQRDLADRVRTALTAQGCRDGFAYNHDAYRRLVGMVSKSKVEALLYDLRTLPAQAQIPGLPSHETAIRVIEVMPEGMPAVPAPKAPPTPPSPELEKIAPSLRSLIGNKEALAKLTRLEIVLVFDPTSKDHLWQTAFRSAVPGLVIEGITGTLVTVQAVLADAVKLAALPEVALVRLPVPATRGVIIGESAKETDNQRSLRASGVERIHKLKYIGQGVNLAVIDSDFRGWEPLVGTKFPKSTHYVDFTSERNPDMKPDPFPEGDGLGHGTRCALVALLAAPGADLTLIRVDPAAPYQVEQAARYIHGDSVYSFPFERRRQALQAAAEALELRRDKLARERKQILDDFGQDEENKKRRADYFKRAEDYDRDEAAQRELTHRYLAIATIYKDLRKVRAVVSTLAWNEGHPVDGLSAPSRYFDDRAFRGILWFQPAGDTRGQVWTGLFRDVDGNGVMEFAPLADPSKSENIWRLELNRLAWLPDTGDVVLDLPAKTRVRLTMQWREPHDPRFLRDGEDAYARPLANLQMMVLHQLDPEGKQRPTDDLEVVGQTIGPALRIQNLAASAAYEQELEFEVAQAGQYFLRVAGTVIQGTQPPGSATLPSQRKDWELKPRIFIQTFGAGGRVVFRDHFSENGTVAAPADARHVVTVGAVDQEQKPRPYSAAGAPLDVELLRKPDLATFDDFSVSLGRTEHGTAFAASYAVGAAATLLSAGLPPTDFVKQLQAHPGQTLAIPEKWSEKTPLPAKR